MPATVGGAATYTVDLGGVLYEDGVPMPEFAGTDVNHVNGSTLMQVAVTEHGHAVVWGMGTPDLFGDGSKNTRPGFRGPRPIPLHIFGGRKVLTACLSDTHLLVMLVTGKLFTSGDFKGGSLGLGAQDGRDRFVTTLTEITDPEFASVPTQFIVTAYAKTIAQRTDGSLFTWGQNSRGVLGLDHFAHVFSPTRLDFTTPGRIVHVSACQHHSVAVMEDGSTVVWGENQYGQLGLDDKVPRSVPVLNPAMRGATASASGSKHTVVLSRAGKVFVAGNAHCTSIDGDDKSRCMRYKMLAGIPSIVSVHAGHKRTVLVSGDGALFEFGVSRDLYTCSGFDVNDAPFRCTRADPPTRIVHPARVGMHVYRLPPQRALAVAMLRHARCGSASLWRSMPADLVRKIIDAASTPGFDGDPGRLGRVCDRY